MPVLGRQHVKLPVRSVASASRSITPQATLRAPVLVSALNSPRAPTAVANTRSDGCAAAPDTHPLNHTVSWPKGLLTPTEARAAPSAPISPSSHRVWLTAHRKQRTSHSETHRIIDPPPPQSLLASSWALDGPMLSAVNPATGQSNCSRTVLDCGDPTDRKHVREII